MTTPSSLLVIAAVTLALAGAVAFVRGLAVRDALADALSASLGALAVLGIAVLLFALSRPLDAPSFLKNAASVALVASPVAASVALRFRGRRSLPRALLLSGLAGATLLLWLTLRFKGIRGGWTVPEVAWTTAVAGAALALAACAGWWSRRATGRPAPR